MSVLMYILAQPLAPDNIWFVLLLALVLALMHSLGSPRDRTATHRHAQRHLHGISHRLQEWRMHRHH